MKKILILGAGVTGLSLASKLSESGEIEVKVLEKEGFIGGASGSFEYDGCILDYGPHKFFPQTELVEAEISRLIGEDLLTVEKKSSIMLQNRYFTYPFSMSELLLGLDKKKAFDSVFLYVLEKMKRRTSDPLNYEEAIISSFGRGLYEMVFEPQATKIWGDPKTLSPDLANLRVPSPGLLSLVLQIIMKKDTVKGRKVNAQQYYYPRKGIVNIAERFADIIKINKGSIELNSIIKNIKTDKQYSEIKEVIYSSNGSEKYFTPDILISTIPIDDFIEILDPVPSDDVLSAAKDLNYRGSMIIYFVVKKENLSENQWIFYPEMKYRFNRLYEQKRFSEETVKYSDRTIIGLDLNLERDDPLFSMDLAELKRIFIPELLKTSMLSEKDIEEVFVKKWEKIYPIYDLSYKVCLDKIMKFESGINNLFFLGRQGLFNYNNMDHCIDMGLRLADHLVKGSAKSEFWEVEREYYNTYRIID